MRQLKQRWRNKMQDIEEDAKLLVIQNFIDLLVVLKTDYVILPNVDIHGKPLESEKIFSVGLFKNEQLLRYICLIDDSFEVVYQRVSNLVLDVIKEIGKKWKSF